MADANENRELDAVLRRFRVAVMAGRIARAVFKWLTFVSVVWLTLFLLDNAAGLPSGLRLFFLLTAALFTIYTLVALIGKAVIHVPGLDRTAILLEEECGIRRNLLINSLQLGRHRHSGPTAQFARRTVSNGSRKASEIPLSRVLEPVNLAVWALLTAAMLGMWGTYLRSAPLRLDNAITRFARPLANVEPLRRARLRLIPGSDLMVVENEDLEIVAVMEGAGDNPLPPDELRRLSPRILIQPGTAHISGRTGAEHGIRMLPMTREADLDALVARLEMPPGQRPVAFRYRVNRVRSPFAYAVFSPNVQVSTPSVRVGVFRTPRIAAAQFIVTPPDYTGSAAAVRPGPPDILSGLAGSRVRAEVTLDQAVDRLFWESTAGRSEFERLGGPEGRSWTAETQLTSAGAYLIEAEVEGLKHRSSVATGGTQLRDDLPPHVAIAGELSRRELVAGERLKLEILGADDFGIAWLSVNMRRPEGGETRVLRRWEFGQPPGVTGTMRQEMKMQLVPSIFRPGSDYIIEAVCRDFCPGGEAVYSAPLLIGIKPPALPPGAEQAYRAACAALDRAIRAQERALGASRNMLEYLDDILDAETRDTAGKDSFLRHELALSQMQAEVASFISETIRHAVRIPPSPPGFVKHLDSINRFPVKQAIGMISALGQVDRWLGPDPVALHSGEFANTNILQTVTFPEAKGRYVILDANSAFSIQAVTIAELAFLDSNSRPFPRRFVRNWQVARTANPWNPDRGFATLGRDRIETMLDLALQAPMSRADGPCVHLAQFIEPVPEEHVACYVAREIFVEEAREITMLTGSSDSLRVWLNGWLVTELQALREAQPDEDSTVLRLAPGRNTLLVEVSSAASRSALYMRLADEDGRPLALSDTGNLRPAPEWKVNHVHRPGEEHAAIHALDGDPSTFWEGPGAMPQGIVVDLGTDESLTGFSYLSHRDAMGAGIKQYDFHLVDSLRARETLPGALNALIMLQTVILDRLTTIRGEGVGQVQRRTEFTDKPGSEEEDADTEETIRDFLDDLARFQGNSHEVSRSRDEILDQSKDARKQQSDRLDELKHDDMNLAGELSAASLDLDRLRDVEPPAPDRQEALQDMLDSAAQLTDLAERKAGLPPDRSTSPLDDRMDDLCNDIRDAGQRAMAPAAAPSSQETDGEVDSGESAADLAAEIDRREHALRDRVEEIESSLTARELDRGEAAPGAALSTGEESRDGTGLSEDRSDMRTRSDMGQTGMADGQATGDTAEDTPDSTEGLQDRVTDSKAHEGSITEGSGAAQESGTGDGTQMDAAADTGPGGKMSPEMLEEMESVYQDQKQIRESARFAANRLKSYNLPTAEFEEAIVAMGRVEAALQETDAAELKRAYSEAVSLTTSARRSLSDKVGLQYLRSRTAAWTGARRHVRGRSAPPKGYEEMVGAYFRKLAGAEMDAPRRQERSERP